MDDDYNAELKQSGLDQQSATNVKNHVTLVKVTSPSPLTYSLTSSIKELDRIIKSASW